MSQKKEGKRGGRPPSAPALRVRRLLAKNVQFLMDRSYPPNRYKGKAEQQRAFAKDTGVSWSTVQRVLDAHKGKTLDIIADLAVALEVKAGDLLLADLASATSSDSIPFDGTDGHP